MPQDHCFSNNIAAKIQTQETIVKDFHSEKAKAKHPKAIFSHTNTAELLEQNRKNKKNRTKEQKQDITGERKERTPATGDNTINVSKKKKRNVSKVTCFNYNKKGNYASTYTKPPKN